MIAVRDLKYVWHPYTQMQGLKKPVVIAKGEGSYLYTDDGRKLIDANASWWVNLHGHAHPYIIKKISDQLHTLEHAMFTDFTHAPAVDLAEKLIHIAPGNLRKVFFSDNGSTATETAIKIALQYWYNVDPKTPRKRVICFKNGYHGDTFGAMSVGGRSHFNLPFHDHLFPTSSIDTPLEGTEQTSVSQLEALLCQGDVACFIFEPLIQGPGGMRIYSAKGLDHLIKICQQHSIITIADEVMTGFGRTGPLFACDNLIHKPDIICLSKGITGGFLPLGATLCTESIFQGFYSSNSQKTFLHGHSYCANPLACSAAIASLDLLNDITCVLQRQMIETLHREFALTIQSHHLVQRCEVLGTLFILEYKESFHSSYYSPIGQLIKDFFLENDIIIRPLGNVLYLIPPYCIKQEDLFTIYTCIKSTLENPLWTL